MFEYGQALHLEKSSTQLAASLWVYVEETLNAIRLEGGGDELYKYAIIAAARVGNINLLKTLLDESISPDSNLLRNALRSAAIDGRIDSTKRLLRYPKSLAALKKDDIGPFYFAAEHGHLDILEELLEKWPQATKRLSKKKDSPITASLRSARASVLNLLIEKGFEIESSPSEISKYAYNAVNKLSIDFAELLWDKFGADPQYSESGDNAFYLAAAFGGPALFENMRARGIDPYQINTRGFTSLHRACMSENTDGLLWLLESATIDPKSFTNDKNLLSRSIEFGRLNSIRTLLDWGFDPDEPIADGKTAIELAQIENKQAVIYLLLQYSNRAEN